jgi:hypothetical protein
MLLKSGNYMKKNKWGSKRSLHERSKKYEPNILVGKPEKITCKTFVVDEIILKCVLKKWGVDLIDLA